MCFAFELPIGIGLLYGTVHLARYALEEESASKEEGEGKTNKAFEVNLLAMYSLLKI